jgi:hypothetical protein
MPNQNAFPYSLQAGLASPQPNTPFDRRDLLSFQGSNIVQSSRYIDPLTKDFVVSPNNHLLGMNAIDQSVFLALNITFNTSAQPGLGQNFLSPKVIPPVSHSLATLKQQMSSLLNQCLSFQVSNQQITITQVEVAYGGQGQVQLFFAYINNSNGQKVDQQFTLQG